MTARTLAIALTLVVTAASAGKDKAPPSGKVSNDRIEIEAVVHLDQEKIRGLLGEAPEGIAVVELRVFPRGKEPLAVNPDDFMLRSDRDGQKAQPFAPSQIAGDAVLVVGSSGSGGGGVVGQESGPIWGGGPGTGGRPRRIGDGGGSVGNVAGDETVQARIESGGKDKENPLLRTLKEKMLPARKITEPMAGLLYFPLEGKHKPKDLELMYRGPAGKLFVRFK